MPSTGGTLSSASPPGPEDGWFAPTGAFVITRDAGSGTLALNARAFGDSGVGAPTGDTIAAGEGKQGSAGAGGGIQYRLTLASGVGPVVWKAIW